MRRIWIYCFNNSRSAFNAGAYMRYLPISWAIFILFIFQAAYGQQYGLRFSGAEVPQYQRTSLVLNEGNYFTIRDNFRITFQLSYPPDLLRYYGYILRIVDDENQNIDLIFNYRDISVTSLNVIYGKEQTNILLETSLTTLLDRWVDIEMAYDHKNNSLTLVTGDTAIVADNIQLSHKVKFFFGRNNYEHTRTVDVPPMKIRDIKLYKGERLLHHWPLTESTGSIATDIIKGNRALIENPTWIRRLFQNWQKIYADSLAGQAAVAYDEKLDRLFFPGQQDLISYNLSEKRTTKISFEKFSENYLAGRQAIYDEVNQRLILFNIWNNSFRYFDPDSLAWIDLNTGTDVPAVFWHYNKYLSKANDHILVFGGYGQYEFQNIVQRFSLSSKKYDILKTSGDVYHPRYLASLGQMNDTIYLLGGHGSVSGKQIENPTEFFDFTLFSLNDNTYIKRYEFEPPFPDAVFANNMFIHPDRTSFYALTFPYFEHFGYLQLIKGSLYKPVFELVGDRIPFQFEDISSYADLYYSKSLNKLIAITLFYNRTSNQTHIAVYTISYPPDTVIPDSPLQHQATNSIALKIIIGLLLLIPGAMLIVFMKRRRKNQDIISQDAPAKELIKQAKEDSNSAGDLDDLPVLTEKDEVVHKNTILFFGGFKIFNRQSVDITNKFSPLLKEIFLLIWLNSFEGQIGRASCRERVYPRV